MNMFSGNSPNAKGKAIGDLEEIEKMHNGEYITELEDMIEILKERDSVIAFDK